MKRNEVASRRIPRKRGRKRENNVGSRSGVKHHDRDDDDKVKDDDDETEDDDDETKDDDDDDDNDNEDGEDEDEDDDDDDNVDEIRQDGGRMRVSPGSQYPAVSFVGQGVSWAG